jgi:hypothetical protein
MRGGKVERWKWSKGLKGGKVERLKSGKVKSFERLKVKRLKG